MIALFSGLLAGSLHVLSGPDHLAAIAPLTVRAPRAGSALGAVWGVGHGGGILLWVVLAALFRRWFGGELPAPALEALVGVSLMALGAFSVAQHAHAPHPVSARSGRMAAFTMGALHGSAGASHLFALLPALGLTGVGAFQYAAGYLLAGVLAMASVGSLIGRLSGRVPDLVALRRVSGVCVLALGAVWLLRALSDLA